MRTLLLGLFFIGLTGLCYAQIEQKDTLAEVEVYATNYDYLKSVKSKDIMPIINQLERKVANFDVKSLNLNPDQYEKYNVMFFIPTGEISALYDNGSNIISTIEKFTDVNLPMSVVKSVKRQYPDWSIKGDMYVVRYHHNKGVKKRYKIFLQNADKRRKIVTDENGTIL